MKSGLPKKRDVLNDCARRLAHLRLAENSANGAITLRELTPVRLAQRKTAFSIIHFPFLDREKTGDCFSLFKNGKWIVENAVLARHAISEGADKRDNQITQTI